MNDARREVWDRRFLEMAATIGSWSKDPSTKVGAVIVAPDLSIVSLGFNGLPRGLEDTQARYENRELKYKMVLHLDVRYTPTRSSHALVVPRGLSRPGLRERWHHSLQRTYWTVGERAST